MKAIEWFKKLPPGYRERAIKRTVWNDPKDSLENALIGAFGWALTKEGHNFWSDLYKNLNSPSKFPPLPPE